MSIFSQWWRKLIWTWKKEHKRCLLAHSFAEFLPVEQFWLAKAKVACLATIFSLAKSPLMGQLAVVAAAWARSVICDYRGQSDVAGDGECRFTPVENYTSAGLKGLAHLHRHTNVPFTGLIQAHTHAHIQCKHSHAHTPTVQSLWGISLNTRSSRIPSHMPGVSCQITL